MGSSDVTLDYHGYKNKWSSPDTVTLTTSAGGLISTTEHSSAVTVAITDPSSPVLVSYVVYNCIYDFRTIVLSIHIAFIVAAHSQGTLGFPDGCQRASCNAYVQWRLGNNNTVRFELEGKAEGWVAVGVSADQVMGVNGIDDVFACQRDATDDTVYAQDMYNPENQSPRSNKRDSVCYISSTIVCI